MSDRPSGASDYDTKIIEEFRGDEGRAGGPWAGATLILLHHIGVRSGTERVSPLATSLKEKAASPSWPPTEDRQPPDRYYNLKAHPGSPSRWAPRRSVLAEELSHARAELWPKLVAETPALSEFQARTRRQIPVVMLTRQD